MGDLRSQNATLQVQNSILHARVNALEVEKELQNSALKKYQEQEIIRQIRFQESMSVISSNHIPNMKKDQLCIQHFKMNGDLCKNGDLCHSAHYVSDYSGTQTYQEFKAYMKKTTRITLCDTKWNMIKPCSSL